MTTTTSPCHTYITCTFGQGDLGFTAAPAPSPGSSSSSSEAAVWLGNILCVDIKASSQAERQGLLAMDALVCINHEYVAFSTPQQALSKLATAAYSRPLSLTFARPRKQEWLRIGGGGLDVDATVVVKSGELEKQGRFFRRNREFVLTRRFLSYSDDLTGSTKKRLPVEEITRIVPAGGGGDASRVVEFSFVFQQVEHLLRAPTRDECVQWMHALETVKRGCFENVPATLAWMERASNKQQEAAASSSPTPAPNPRPAATAPKPVVVAVNTSPYALLTKYKLTITAHSNSSNGNGTPLTSLPPPIPLPSSSSSAPVIDLSLENKILSKS